MRRLCCRPRFLASSHPRHRRIAQATKLSDHVAVDAILDFQDGVACCKPRDLHGTGCTQAVGGRLAGNRATGVRGKCLEFPRPLLQGLGQPEPRRQTDVHAAAAARSLTGGVCDLRIQGRVYPFAGRTLIVALDSPCCRRPRRPGGAHAAVETKVVGFGLLQVEASGGRLAAP